MTTKTNSVDNAQALAWQSKKEFTASTTLSEKVWRVVNDLVFVAAGVALGAIVNRQIRLAPPAMKYASYATIALAVRKIVSTAIGYAVYPAITMFSKEHLRQEESQFFTNLQKHGFVTQKISLHKSGVAYDATIVGHKDTISNGKWVVHALGKGMAMENSISELAQENRAKGVNTLLINGPAVGRSRGYPTRYQLGAGFEAGLQFLEKEVKATHIAFKGLSLGGGMMSEAVQTHEFDTSKVKYLGISDRSFSYLSSTAASFVGFIATVAFFLTGTELDGVAGAEKLKKLNIEHIIIQHSSPNNQGTDGVIKDRVALAPALEKAPNRTFLLSPQIPHNGYLPSDVESQLNAKIKEFFLSEGPVTLA